MAITISAVPPGFVAKIGDIDLAQPLLPAECGAKQAFWDSIILISLDQEPSEPQIPWRLLKLHTYRADIL